jgi:hypothetical protein
MLCSYGVSEQIIDNTCTLLITVSVHGKQVTEMNNSNQCLTCCHSILSCRHNITYNTNGYQKLYHNLNIQHEMVENINEK